MQGIQCDYCRKFSPYSFSNSGMFGNPVQTMPANWVIMTEEKPQSAVSGLLDVISSTPEQPRQPSVFCSRECARDFLIARSLVEGPAAS